MIIFLKFKLLTDLKSETNSFLIESGKERLCPSIALAKEEAAPFPPSQISYGGQASKNKPNFEENVEISG